MWIRNLITRSDSDSVKAMLLEVGDRLYLKDKLSHEKKKYIGQNVQICQYLKRWDDYW